jgi:hypothetical protein
LSQKKRNKKTQLAKVAYANKEIHSVRSAWAKVCKISSQPMAGHRGAHLPFLVTQEASINRRIVVQTRQDIKGRPYPKNN